MTHDGQHIRPYRTVLGSQRGASFLIALVLLLVCAVVASLIVVSASTSAERRQVGTAEQRDYYALSSALETARSMCTDEGPVANLVLTAGSGALVNSGTADSSDLAQWALESANRIANGSDAETHTLYVSAEVGDKPDIPEVKLTFSMDKAYAITITAELADDPAAYGSVHTTVAVQGNDPNGSGISWKEATS